MLKRFTISQKNSMKPIILSDESETTIEEDSERVKEIFKARNIYTFRTSNDCLVGRPSELQSILISESKNNHNHDFKKEIEKSKLDKDGLKLDDSNIH